MSAADKHTKSDFDVVIVGAGISGINAAYRIQTELPGCSYTILEARGAIGGTWDLFRYPGIRSDSDLYTFGFPWRPWESSNPIADGALIRTYINESAEMYGIDKQIRFHHKLISGDWSSDSQTWALSVDENGSKTTLTAKFLVFCTGYYDYDEPLQTNIPGIESFKGTVVHPQFWPDNLEYSGKKIVIIGSGATAVTLLPALAKKAEKVTMLQRSPSYVLSLPTKDPVGDLIRIVFPKWLSHRIVRMKFIIFPFIFYQFCRVFPAAAKNLLRMSTESQLPKSIPHDPNFKPSYNPWEQRLCICPDGDFFKALGEDNADVVTDHIKTVTENGILTESGKHLESDIIITATGLKLRIAGGADISVDGKFLEPGNLFLWRGVMVQNLPNAAFVIGYTNASWTIGSDINAKFICRLLKYLESNKMASAVPQIKDPSTLKAGRAMNLSSTYVEAGKDILPKVGDKGPWKRRSNYVMDPWTMAYGSITSGLHFTKVFDRLG